MAMITLPELSVLTLNVTDPGDRKEKLTPGGETKTGENEKLTCKSPGSRTWGSTRIRFRTT
jgi:hypothetical protein